MWINIGLVMVISYIFTPTRVGVPANNQQLRTPSLSSPRQFDNLVFSAEAIVASCGNTRDADKILSSTLMLVILNM